MDLATLSDRIKHQPYSFEAAYYLMGLNAMCYLDPGEYSSETANNLGASHFDVIPTSGDYLGGCIVQTVADLQIVAFTGTRGISGWFQYVQGAESNTPWGRNGGMVFTPFYNTAARLRPLLTPMLNDRFNLVFTGHSLGASAAAMLTENYVNAGWNFAATYTFGAPRLGVLVYCRNYRPCIVMMNNPIDPVPYLPTNPIRQLRNAINSHVADESHYPVGQSYPLI